MSSSLALVIAKFLVHSWRDIEFEYEQLTPEEQSHGSKEDFERLVATNWEHIAHYEPEWFEAHGFRNVHRDAALSFKEKYL